LPALRSTPGTLIWAIPAPLVACFGVLYLGEPPAWRLIIGASLIFGCGVGLSLLPSGSKADQPLTSES